MFGQGLISNDRSPNPVRTEVEKKRTQRKVALGQVLRFQTTTTTHTTTTTPTASHNLLWGWRLKFLWRHDHWKANLVCTGWGLVIPHCAASTLLCPSVVWRLKIYPPIFVFFSWGFGRHWGQGTVWHGRSPNPNHFWGWRPKFLILSKHLGIEFCIRKAPVFLWSAT